MRNLEYLLLHDLFPVYYVDALSRLLYVATLQVVVVAVCVGVGRLNTINACRHSVAIDLNLFYTFRRVCQNGGAVYFRCLILFCGFYYKGSFAVCSCTIGVVIEYTFGDGISVL